MLRFLSIITTALYRTPLTANTQHIQRLWLRNTIKAGTAFYGTVIYTKDDIFHALCRRYC